MPKCPHCGKAELEQHNKYSDLLICPQCWHKYDKKAALKGQFILIRKGEIVSRQTVAKKEKITYTIFITIMAHKPAGIWQDTWYSVTCAEKIGAHACSEPFGNSKEISARVDKMKACAKKRYLIPKFELSWVKEDPSLNWHREEGTKDWKEVFNV